MVAAGDAAGARGRARAPPLDAQVPKFPDPPGVDAVRRIAPAIRTLTKGVSLARVYFTGGEHPTRWDEFRHYGPTSARFDHHRLGARGEPETQDRSIL